MTDFVTLVAEALPNLVHPGNPETGEKPFGIPLPGIRVTAVPPEMAGQFAADAGLPSTDFPRLIAEALKAALAPHFDLDTSKAEVQELRQAAADAPDGTRIINICTTPTSQPALQLTVGKTDQVIVPASVLKTVGENA